MDVIDILQKSAGISKKSKINSVFIEKHWLDDEGFCSKSCDISDSKIILKIISLLSSTDVVEYIAYPPDIPYYVFHFFSNQNKIVEVRLVGSFVFYGDEVYCITSDEIFDLVESCLSNAIIAKKTVSEIAHNLLKAS